MEWLEGRDPRWTTLTPIARAAPEARRGPRIVITDDDIDVREGLARLFEQDGCMVTALADGTALVRHLARCAEADLLPDVIVVDHLMPGFSGLQICEALQDQGWPMPVLLVSAFGREVQVLGESFGAEVVEKPCPPDALKAIVYGAIADALPVLVHETDPPRGAG